MADSKAGKVFSGATRLSPRWAITSTSGLVTFASAVLASAAIVVSSSDAPRIVPANNVRESSCRMAVSPLRSKSLGGLLRGANASRACRQRSRFHDLFFFGRGRIRGDRFELLGQFLHFFFHLIPIVFGNQLVFLF